MEGNDGKKVNAKLKSELRYLDYYPTKNDENLTIKVRKESLLIFSPLNLERLFHTGETHYFTFLPSISLCSLLSLLFPLSIKSSVNAIVVSVQEGNDSALV